MLSRPISLLADFSSSPLETSDKSEWQQFQTRERECDCGYLAFLVSLNLLTEFREVQPNKILEGQSDGSLHLVMLSIQLLTHSSFKIVKVR